MEHNSQSDTNPEVTSKSSTYVDNNENPSTPSRKRPIFFKFRSSRHLVLFTVALGIFVDMFIYSVIVPIMPFHLRDHLGFVEDNISSTIGILLGLYAVGLLIGSPLFGYLGDRCKKRQYPMALGILGMIASTILFMFSLQFWVLLVARFLQGLSGACIWTVGFAMLSDNFPDEIGSAIGKVVPFLSLGMLSGNPIGGSLYEAKGYHAVFGLCIAMAVIDLLARLLLVEKRGSPPEWWPENSTPNEKPLEDENVPKRSLASVLFSPRMLAGLLITFSEAFIFAGPEATFPVHLHQTFGLESTQIGLVFIAIVFPTFIFSPIGGYLSDRYGSRLICVVGLLLAGMCTMLLGVPNSLATFIVLLFFFGSFGAVFIAPMIGEFSLIVRVPGSDPDTAITRSYALFNMAFGLGLAVGPIVCGRLLDQIGFFYVGIFMGAMCFFAAPFAALWTGDGWFKPQTSTENVDTSTADV
ncbi:uncharacterized protein VTP21DRAFT_10080 [Calcarisporiella thermophila]|uniref:uncharacterized protein n=1 Tax=Calcarisporiella thermophila TaxID=911321 RepID=UPI0037438205